jgi:YbbR domain-containing protein
MRQLLYLLLVENALLKLVSLVLALVLFVVVRGDKDAATSAYAKVVYVLPEDRVLMTDPVPEVRLGLRGPWTRVSRLDEREIAPIRVNLTSARDGEVSFTEDMISLPVGLHLASISPSSVKVRFEPKVTRRVPVQPILEGEPAQSYRVVRTEAHPREARITGAKSVVEAVQRARTRPFRVTDARQAVHGDVALEAPPPRSLWEEGVVTVDVEVAPVLAERRLSGMSILVTGAVRLDARVEPAMAEVVLRGPADALAGVEPGRPSLLVDAAAEDARVPGAYRKRIHVVGLPEGVAAEIRPESVTLITRRRHE